MWAEFGHSILVLENIMWEDLGQKFLPRIKMIIQGSLSLVTSSPTTAIKYVNSGPL